MKTIAERLAAFIDLTGQTKNKFAATVGTSSALISKLTTQNTDFRIGILLKIVAKYPGLNLNWLLTGVGDMIVEQSTTNNGSSGKATITSYSPDSMKAANESVQLLRNEGRFQYLSRFREKLKHDHPDLQKLSEDVSNILWVGDVIHALHNSNIGDVLFYGVSNLKQVKGFSEFYTNWVQIHSRLLPYQEIISNFSSASLIFIKEVGRNKEVLDIDFDFSEDE